MTAYICPKGHSSADADFCSDCGARIGSSSGSPSGLAGGPPPPQVLDMKCPDCGTIHSASAIRFCEVCGYNFETGGHGEIPAPEPPPPPPQPPPPPSPPPPPAPPAKLTWQVLITIDPSLRTPESPEAPVNQPPLEIALSKESNLIGRRSVARAIEPDIPLDQDAAVSHRHALLILQPDQTLLLRDIGSSNGTSLNGVDIQPMTDTPLKDGDQITIGHWTRIVVHAKAT